MIISVGTFSDMFKYEYKLSRPKNIGSLKYIKMNKKLKKEKIKKKCLGSKRLLKSLLAYFIVTIAFRLIDSTTFFRYKIRKLNKGYLSIYS